LRPSHAESHLGLGTAYALQGNFPAAEQEYREALRWKSDWPDALVNLAAAVRNQGRPVEAYRYYEQALHLDPNNARALRGMSDLRGS
jgi:Flp pilus assembly protein TadD